MRIEWTESPNAFAAAAGGHVLAALKAKPDSVVALPTGATPQGLYQFLAGQQDIGATIQRTFFFNLDEYVGISQSHCHSFAAFLRRHFLDPASVRPEQMRLLHGDAPDPVAEALSYDVAIAARGGIDLAILGLGANGHIAFNEPGAGWNTGTHIVALTPQTREANATYVPAGTEVPAYGITMGIGMLRTARQVLLLVRGESKREALHAFLEGRPNPVWPVTSLCDHPTLIVVADRALAP